MFAEHAEHAVVGSQAIGCRGPGGHKVRLMSSPRPLVNRGPKWSGPGPPLYGLFIQNLFKVLLEGQKSILARPPRASHAYTSHLPSQTVVLLVGGEKCMAAPAVSTLRSSLCQRGSMEVWVRVDRSTFRRLEIWHFRREKGRDNLCFLTENV